MQLGLVSHRAVQDRLHGLDIALEPFEGVEHRLSDAAANADLVPRLCHGPSVSAAGVIHRHPRGVIGVRVLTRAG